MSYIALVRGINVTGRNMVRMKDLVKAFVSLGYTNVQSYVQSGNLVFDHGAADTGELARTIEGKIEKSLGISVKVIVRTARELEKIVRGNPFIKDPALQPDKLHVTFLAGKPGRAVVSAIGIKKEKNELFTVSGREVYLYCPNGYGRTNLNNAAFEKALGVSATTRNWRTTTRLLELSGGKKP